MVLNNWENYPFWATLFTGLGWHLVCSSGSDSTLLKESASTVMSDNICYPAKLVHSHILDLINRRVDRIFFPRVTYEHSHFSDSANQYNCPIITGYPDVIDCAIDPSRHGVQMDSPLINFKNIGQLHKGCADYLSSFAIEKTVFEQAFGQALEVQQSFRKTIRDKGMEVIASARARRHDRRGLGDAGARPSDRLPLRRGGGARAGRCLSSRSLESPPSFPAPLMHLGVRHRRSRERGR